MDLAKRLGERRKKKTREMNAKQKLKLLSFSKRKLKRHNLSSFSPAPNHTPLLLIIQALA